MDTHGKIVNTTPSDSYPYPGYHPNTPYQAQPPPFLEPQPGVVYVNVENLQVRPNGVYVGTICPPGLRPPPQPVTMEEAEAPVECKWHCNDNPMSSLCYGLISGGSGAAIGGLAFHSWLGALFLGLLFFFFVFGLAARCSRSSES